MQNVIERAITVNAPAQRVYEAITSPEQIIQWFPDAIEGSLAVGEQPVLSFTEHAHQARIYVEAADPHTYFAYRWIPGGNSPLVEDVRQVPNTLVEFIIEEQTEGTKVTLKESGFAELPAEVAAASFKDNSGGWEYMMGRLEKVLSQA